MLKRRLASRLFWIAVALLLVFVDQLSKMGASLYLEKTQSLTWFSGFGFGFDLSLRHNTGAAFSFLAEASGWQRWFFIGLALFISIILIVWLLRLSPHQKLESLALSCILGGALGNALDRIFHGHVIDFILLYYKDWQFPAFNIADTAIFMGTLFLVIHLWTENHRLKTT